MTESQRAALLLHKLEEMHHENLRTIEKTEKFLEAMRKRPETRPETRVTPWKKN